MIKTKIDWVPMVQSVYDKDTFFGGDEHWTFTVERYFVRDYFRLGWVLGHKTSWYRIVEEVDLS